MSDFELLILYSEQVSLFFTVITVLSTILFSFLAAMYFVAGRMNGWLVIILSGLFSAVSFGLVNGVYASAARAAAVGAQIIDRIDAPGSEIAWLSRQVMPADIATAFYWFFLIAIVLALLFVVIRRREQRRERAVD